MPAEPSTHPSRSRPGPGRDLGDAVLHVVAWVDPVIDELGHDPRSHYVEHYWLGVLGPSM